MTRIVSWHSGRGGVGKTMIATNVAQTLARQGKNIFLAEMDFRVPCFGLIFGQDPPCWLNDFVEGNAPIEETPIDFTAEFGTKGKLCNVPARAMDTTSVVNADRILANSQWTAEKISRIYGMKPEICYPGVGLTFYHELVQDDGLPLRPQNGHDFILSTSRHYPQKKLEWLIQAASQLRNEVGEHKLVFTGRATAYTNQLRRLAESFSISESVIFLGEVGEALLTKLYRRAGVCAFPAPDEDFGLGPLEAGLCRTPSVVWDYAGHAETVVQSETGFRATPYVIEDFADKMISVLGDDSLRNRMGRNAYELAATKFSWEKHNDMIEETLASIA